MFVKVLSSRDTAIGMLRFGVIYKLDDKDFLVKEVIKKLQAAKPSPIKVLSKKQVEAENAKAVPFKLPSVLDQGDGKAPAKNLVAVQQELVTEVADLTKDKEGLVAEVAGLINDKEGLTAEVADLTKGKDGLVAEIAELVDKKEELEAAVQTYATETDS